MYVLYYASLLQCWHLVWILVRTDHPCLGVGCHMIRAHQLLVHELDRADGEWVRVELHLASIT
jgi:hypothetical protein